jgi:hypothetical protein
MRYFSRMCTQGILYCLQHIVYIYNVCSFDKDVYTEYCLQPIVYNVCSFDKDVYTEYCLQPIVYYVCSFDKDV